ncbi:MAG: AAA family ATPase [Parachlamydiales bacterium]|nr:AAA family ATPase [Parachlamydiales bacterium]
MKRKPVKICCSGSHGVGKSTLAFQLASFFKFKEKNVKVIDEIVRTSPFPINELAPPECEYWLCHQQIIQELEAYQHGYEIIICDRGSWDAIQYWIDRNLPNDYFYHLEHAMLQWMDTYHAIVLVEPDTQVLHFSQDNIRSGNQDFRKRMVKHFQDAVKKLPSDAEKNLLTITSSEIFDHPAESTALKKIIRFLLQKNVPILSGIGDLQTLTK